MVPAERPDPKEHVDHPELRNQPFRTEKNVDVVMYVCMCKNIILFIYIYIQ